MSDDECEDDVNIVTNPTPTDKDKDKDENKEKEKPNPSEKEKDKDKDKGKESEAKAVQEATSKSGVLTDEALKKLKQDILPLQLDKAAEELLTSFAKSYCLQTLSYAAKVASHRKGRG